MMDERYAVWLTSEGARLFLGLDAPEPRTRWVVVGKGDGEEPASGVGFWLQVEYVQRRPADAKPEDFEVGPPRCLIRWDYVITIQSLGPEAEPFDWSEHATMAEGEA